MWILQLIRLLTIRLDSFVQTDCADATGDGRMAHPPWWSASLLFRRRNAVAATVTSATVRVVAVAFVAAVGFGMMFFLSVCDGRPRL